MGANCSLKSIRARCFSKASPREWLRPSILPGERAGKSDGSPRSVLSINNDITAQKKLETQLLRAQRLESIGTLASGVAHDLNNILTPILVCTEVLRQHPSPEDGSSAISLIEESARRGAGIVKQVLTFARGIEGERVLINPGPLLDEIIDIARKTFPKSTGITGSYHEETRS